MNINSSKSMIESVESERICKIKDGIKQYINEIRLMIEDICPYSCCWCAVNGYKQEFMNGIDMNLKMYGKNEGALVQNKRDVILHYLTPDDYKFLCSVFYEYFKVKEITLTGGEALLSKSYEEISKSANRLGMDVTVLTKGAGLFVQDSIKKIKNTDRVIFSLDTLNNDDYISMNLPLKDKNKALVYLKKTLKIIPEVIKNGKAVTINTVVKPDDDIDKILQLIKYCVENDIENIKFLELDAEEVLSPYIEDKLIEFINVNLGNEFNLIKTFHKKKMDGKKNKFAEIITRSGKILNVWGYRLMCSEEKLFNKKQQICNSNHKKRCDVEVSKMITINTTGEAIPCSGNPKNKVDLRHSIKTKNTKKLIDKINETIQVISDQKCPV